MFEPGGDEAQKASDEELMLTQVGEQQWGVNGNTKA